MTTRDDDEYSAEVSEQLALADARRESIPLVRNALKLIRPAPEARSHCGYEITMAENNISFELSRHWWGARLKSTTTKRAARSASDALKRAINKLDGLSSLVGIQEQQFFNSSDPDEAFPRDKVLKLTETLDQAARAPYGQVIQEKAERKRLAAMEARRLLLAFRKDRITAAKGSRYVLLTALLSGDPKADLSSVCRAHLRQMKAAIKR
jgi:hypothetical protein